MSGALAVLGTAWRTLALHLPVPLAFLLTAALAFLAATPSRAEAPLAVRAAEWGEYVVRRDNGTLAPRYNPTGPARVVTVEGTEFVARTTRIVAHPCLRFGVLWAAEGVPPAGARATFRTTHPRMVRPDGVASEGATWELPVVEGKPLLAGYALTEAWERVPGPWTFSVLFSGRVLAEMRFEVVPPVPGTAPELNRCGPAVS